MISRVVIISDQSVARGGAETIALTSALWLRNRGVPVTVLAGDAGCNAELEVKGVGVFGMGQRALIDGPGHEMVFRGTFNRHTPKFINEWIFQHDNPETVYHLHQWAHILSPSVFKALRGVAHRLVLTAHDYFLVCPNGAFMDYPHDSVCRRVPLGISCLVTNCDRRHYAHKLWRVARQAVRSAVFDLSRSDVPITVLHPGMLPEFIRGGARPSSLRVLRNPVEALSSDRIRAEDNREFVFIGRVGLDKGTDLACHAAREAGVPLRVIGDGPMRAELQRAYPEVAFNGWCSREALAALVKHARALVMPSRLPEPFGLAAVEALWAGLPVIVTNRALLASEIAAAQVGLTYAQKDSGLAAAMARLAHEDELVVSMSQRAFADTGWMATTPASWTDAVLNLYARRLAASRHKLLQ